MVRNWKRLGCLAALAAVLGASPPRAEADEGAPPPLPRPPEMPARQPDDLRKALADLEGELRRFQRNNYPTVTRGGMSTNHFSRPGSRCTCVSNSFISAAVNLTPLW